MLKDLFYIESIHKECENTLAAIASINGTNRVFAGHFPGKPVLPGVCSLYLVRKCVELFLEVELNYHKIDFCKFTGMANPANPEKFSLGYYWKI